MRHSARQSLRYAGTVTQWVGQSSRDTHTTHPEVVCGRRHGAGQISDVPYQLQPPPDWELRTTAYLTTTGALHPTLSLHCDFRTGLGGLTELQEAVAYARLNVRKEQLKVKCLERVLGNSRNLTSNEYEELLASADAHTAAFIRAVTTITEPFTMEKAELKAEKAKQELKEAELKAEKAELKAEKAKQELKEAELKAELKAEKDKQELKEAELKAEKAKQELKEAELKAELKAEKAKQELKEAELMEVADNEKIKDFISNHIWQRKFLRSLKGELTDALGDRTFSDWAQSKDVVEEIVREVVRRGVQDFRNSGPPVADEDHLAAQVLNDIKETARLLHRESDAFGKFVSWRWIDGQVSRTVSNNLQGEQKYTLSKKIGVLKSSKQQSTELGHLCTYLADLHKQIQNLKVKKISTAFRTLGDFHREPLTNVFLKSRGFGNIISERTLHMDAQTTPLVSSILNGRWKLDIPNSTKKEDKPIYFITSMPRQGKSLLLDSIDPTIMGIPCNVYPITYNGGSSIQGADLQCSTMAGQFWSRVIRSIVYCIHKYCNLTTDIRLPFRPTSSAAREIHQRIWGGQPPVIAVDEFSKVVSGLQGNTEAQKLSFSQITCAFDWCSSMVFSGFSTAANTAFTTASGRPSVGITLNPVTRRDEFLGLVPLVSSVCSVLQTADEMYFEAIKSSPGLLGFYLEAMDNGLAQAASKVPWSQAIRDSNSAPLYIESMQHILQHRNFPEDVLVRGIMPCRTDIGRNARALGLIQYDRPKYIEGKPVKSLAVQLEASYLAIQVERSNEHFVQPHVFPWYILVEHICELVPFMKPFWTAMTDRVPMLNAALGQPLPLSLDDQRHIKAITNFALELRSELLVKAIVCAAQMRCQVAVGKDVSSETFCQVFPVMVPIEAVTLAEQSQQWDVISAKLHDHPGSFGALKNMAKIAQSRLQPAPGVPMAARQHAEAVLKLLTGGSRVIEPTDPSNAGSDLSVFTDQADGSYHVDVIEVKYGSGGTSNVGDLGTKYLMTLLGVLHFTKVFRQLDGQEQFRISSVRFHVAALVAVSTPMNFDLTKKSASNKVVRALQSALLRDFHLHVEANFGDVKGELAKLGISVDEPDIYNTMPELEQLVTPPLMHILPNVALCGQF